MRIASALIAGLLLASTLPATAGAPANDRAEAKLAKALTGRVAGTPVDCLRLHDIDSTQIFDRTAILYRTIGGKLYLNRPTAGLPFLDDDSILVTDTHSSDLCSIDTVKLVDRGGLFPRGVVFLDKFVPYTKPATAD